MGVKMSAKVAAALASFKQLVAEKPLRRHDRANRGGVRRSGGMTLALVPRTTFSLWKQETGINDKVLSQLKVIGETLLKVDEKKRWRSRQAIFPPPTPPSTNSVP